ncbi:hypothetical protein F4553_001632 [Allocatelliglobosispora scoriae]|uniref:Uncharacterized protein n=1 Tax=Allocatelliglobosispora scoriae TaxID=643052 RepID=A0A841BMQ3_9ACTN|nr:hypothetical protein [Allocatelliglobosispora scoriae]MBB5868253.1 hypothetical protein [Allocatelliglobosispora scoriae]
MTDEPIPAFHVPAFDERVVRRAMVRGVVRTGLFAALSLMLLLVLVGAASFAVSAVRGDKFFLVAYEGFVVAHPEYEIKQDGSCCATGPFFGFSNLGLASEITLRLQPRGALNYTGSTLITVSQNVVGEIGTTFDAGHSPFLDGVRRGRPTKDATAAFVSGLPTATVVSTLIEFTEPLTPEGFREFFAAAVPYVVSDRSAPVIVVPPYREGSDNPIGWPTPELRELREWADKLGGIDEEHLRSVGLPPLAVIQEAARDGHIYAFVLPRLPAPLLKGLLDNPAVRSANVLDVAFDPDRQTAR